MNGCLKVEDYHRIDMSEYEKSGILKTIRFIFFAAAIMVVAFVAYTYVRFFVAGKKDRN
ncbi:MAG: hypothetical protein M0T81_01200 [Thermoplasmatales archaeon]|jgi:hypothetical protein|nr:hypothetical protein [Thermoplasmatales archaeon]